MSLINRVIFQKRDTKIINKEFSLTKVALTNLGADNLNFIQERLIPLKYYQKSSERLTQTNGEILIINHEISNVHICNDGLCFETVFVLIKELSFKVTLENPFMALLYPFLVTDEGIKPNVLGKDIFFRFILLPVLKEYHSSKKVTILNDINEKGICRIERSLYNHFVKKTLVENIQKIELWLQFLLVKMNGLTV